MDRTMASRPKEEEQIVVVIAHGVRRGVALHREVAQKPVDRLASPRQRLLALPSAATLCRGWWTVIC